MVPANKSECPTGEYRSQYDPSAEMMSCELKKSEVLEILDNVQKDESADYIVTIIYFNIQNFSIFRSVFGQATMGLSTTTPGADSPIGSSTPTTDTPSWAKTRSTVIMS